MADLNGDGLLDVVTGWEEGGVVRVCLNPGFEKARGKWPCVTVGHAGAVEDAAATDVDGDGATDVVSSCEGSVRSIFVHRAPRERAKILQADAWSTEPLPTAAGRMMWMFVLPLQVDRARGTDLVAGGKGPGAQVGWFQAPADPAKLADWRWHPLREAGWIMSLEDSDMDGDGDPDVVFTDRKETRSGCFWLENPGPGSDQLLPWREHRIGGAGLEVMFLTLSDLDRDGLEDVLVAVKPRVILFCRRAHRDGRAWEVHSIELPEDTGTAKAVQVGDINLDGRADIVFTCEDAIPPRSGVMWMSYRGSATERTWQPHRISGSDGIKHDLVQLIDLDGDGDLDVLTCEETRNLGVIWYENPSR